ncbi:DUF4007 family protein [Neptuniibacter sp.]|uniref:DUF4007 family protein n=1 Tax=Neptuniibacter sp. TaxID=1962643 RepID=UPI00262E7B4E|nr:DUF4007 family protein [Neptuniibacter sp.]MCP4597949.1 DUF4007 family protein [Neptuniibacter sp.]
MQLVPETTAFGRHETFALRYGWLTKGFLALKSDRKIFESDDATVQLGVGKNMVTSIRYWLRACQLLETNSTEPTDLGNLLFDPDSGLDPYLEDEATIWLLHWLLASNPKQATTWFWFFNKFHKTNFETVELVDTLKEYVSENVKTKVSPSTLKNDISAITRMYTKSKTNGKLPAEESLDSPFSVLGLITNTHSGFESSPKYRSQLPTAIFAFAVTQFFENLTTNSVPLEQVMYSRANQVTPGAVFRLIESDVVNKLEDMISLIPNAYELRDVAGQLQIFKIGEERATDYLSLYYTSSTQEVAS